VDFFTWTLVNSAWGNFWWYLLDSINLHCTQSPVAANTWKQLP